MPPHFVFSPFGDTGKPLDHLGRMHGGSVARKETVRRMKRARIVERTAGSPRSPPHVETILLPNRRRGGEVADGAPPRRPRAFQNRDVLQCKRLAMVLLNADHE